MNGCDVKRILPDELAFQIQDADAVIAGLEEYSDKLISSARKLKVISRYGVGYDAVDLDAAKKQGVLVTTTPGANGESVADLAIALMMSVARNIPLMHGSLLAGQSVRPSGLELWGKTIGILGTGRIGQAVARRCSGFNMKILGYDMFQSSTFTDELGGAYVELSALFENADFVSLHLPLNSDTRRIIGAATLKSMKSNAIIINTARGGLIDEHALYLALKAGEIRGAGLDVTESELLEESPLLGLENCVLTPHAGAATDEASSKMSLLAAQNVVDVLNTGVSKFVVSTMP